MLRLDQNLLLGIARCLDSNRDMESLSETSKIWHGLTLQLMLPEPVQLRGPGDVFSTRHFRQILLLAKHMHRVFSLRIVSVATLPHDFLAGATRLTDLSLAGCTIEHLPQLPPQLTTLVLSNMTLRQIAPEAFETASDLLKLTLSSVSGLKQLPALPPNLTDLQFHCLDDLTSQLPQLPPRLAILYVDECPAHINIPVELPSSLVSLGWHAEDIDLGPSLEPFTNLVKLALTVTSGDIQGIRDLSPLQQRLQYFDIVGVFDIPNSISTLTNLVKLSISMEEGLGDEMIIPPVLHHLRLLEQLELHPAPHLDSISDLVRLTRLELRYETPVMAPAAVSSLTALIELSIGWNHPGSPAGGAFAALAETNPIPPGLQQLTNLRSLDLDLHSVPHCWTLPALPCFLTNLTISNCVLPSAAVPALTELDLTLEEQISFAACLNSLPVQLHTSLQSLWLREIPVAALPVAVFRLCSLEKLGLICSNDVQYIFPPGGQPTDTTLSSSSSKQSSSSSGRCLSQVTSIKVVYCNDLVAVAGTAELAAEYLPNLKKLSLWYCAAVDEGQLEQLKELLPQLVVERH